MYQFFCDSNCELWHTTVNELGINVINMPYVMDGEEKLYDLGKEHDFKAFFDHMKNGGTPKTTALNEFAYADYFEPVLARGEDIYYISFSHQMSGTFNSMKLAIDKLKEKYPDREIRVKDSKSISLGSGFITYYGALKYREGATMDELDAYFDDLIAHTDVYFAVDDLTYLYRGGRVSGVSRVIGTLLNIKPVLHVDSDGKIVNVSKEKGFKKAIAYMFAQLKAKGTELDKYNVYVLHADNEEPANGLVSTIQATYPNANVLMQPIGPVIGAHCGPGTVGLIFHSNAR
ncbi:MAG: DegV family protein [Clostridia bacterium]|nr:DegV family protein [Clostridia bacterium]